jgi:deoxycytidine triphosphate deaminase
MINIWVTIDCGYEQVSEWLLFNTNSAIFQLYHGENKLIFDEMMTMYTLY